MISTFNVVFTGPITSRYNDKNLEGSHLEGYWVTEKNTPDGKERQRHIETWQDRREWMKQEGLEDAMGAPGGISSDGKSFNSRGLPGTW
jgi:hypothetical protein